MSGAQTGVLVYMFTDIEGSTRLWDERPDDMRPALARHDELVRSIIAAHEGEVFGLAGDGFKVSFRRPQSAVEAARSIQEAMATEPWAGEIELRVRIGLHLGTAEARDGDYFGTAVNRAARVMAAGHGGQVLLSDQVRSVARVEGVRDLGTHRLKDLSAPEQLWQLEIDGSVGDFPPLRTLDAVQSNLPIRQTVVLGREADLGQIDELLDDRALVTLCGPGGVGKTSLSLQAAAGRGYRYDDGVWLVELAPLDPEALAFQFCDVLRIRVSGGREPLEALIDGIGDKAMLLVVDNCEHVRDEAAAVVRAVLEHCPNTSVLATSREPLGIAGEATLFVDPLPIESVGSPAVTLFIERASDANPHLSFDDADRQLIADLCVQLDGLPLAIELAAARMRASSLREIADRLDQRFRLLRSRGDDRHATLHETIAVSHQMLDEQERALFERLSVFAGSFTLRQAEAVCADELVDEFDVLDHLERLVERSMVTADVHGPKARYALLRSLREFGAAELDDPHIWQRRHAEEYARWVGELVPAMIGPQEEELLAELDDGWDDVRAAAGHARSSGDLDLLEDLVEPMSVEALYRGRTELSEWSGAVVDSVEQPRLSTVAVETAVRSVMGDQDRVLELGAEFVRRLADESASAMDQLMVSLSLHLAGDTETTVTLLRSAEATAEAPNLVAKLAWAKLQEALLYTYTARPEEAAEAVEVCRGLIDGVEVGATVQAGFELVDTLRAVDPAARIVERMTAAVAIADRIRCALLRTVSEMVLANARSALGDSAALVDAADVLVGQLASRNFTALAQQLRRAAVMLMRAGDHAAALTILDFIEGQAMAEPNPGTAADLATLTPTSESAVGDERAAITERAREMSQEALVEATVTALRSAASTD